MDLVAELSFAEEPRWVEFCQQHHLPVPQRLDTRAVQELNAIYSKGISQNSPLYRDYRTAVSSRNDDKALQIMRSIARLNPADSNAKKEVERLQNKQVLAKLETLKSLLGTGDHASIANLTDEIETLGRGDQLARHEVFQEGSAIRKAVRLEQGMAESAALLQTAEQQKNRGDWKSVSSTLARIQHLAKERKLTFTAAQSAQLKSLDEFVVKGRDDVKEQVEFERALNTLSAEAGAIDTRLCTSNTLTLREAEGLEQKFAELWKKVEQFQRPVPNAELKRIQEIGAAVRREGNRLRGGIKAKQYAMAATGAIVVGGIFWLGYVTWRAHGFSQQLTDLQSRKMAVASAKLVDDIPNAAPWGATSMPFLRAKMEEVGQWAKGEQDHNHQTDLLLTDLEKAGADDFASLEPKVLKQKLDEATDHVNRLAADLSTVGKDRLAPLRDKIGHHFDILRDKNAAEVQKLLPVVTKAADALSLEKPSAETAAKLKTLEPQLQMLEKLASGEIPDLKLAADIEDPVKKLRSQVDPFLKEASAMRDARRHLAEATALDDYKSALQDFRHLQSPEAGGASPILDSFPTTEGYAALLLFDGSKGAWDAVKLDHVIKFKFMPDDVAADELKVLLQLRDDAMLSEIYEVVTSRGSKGSRHLWSKGRARESSTGLERRWTGMFYDPSQFPMGARFFNESLSFTQLDNGSSAGEKVTSNTPSPVIKLLESLNLTHVTDAKGDHYETPMLVVLDNLVRATQGNAIAKAYLMQRLYQLISWRPYPWGAHYCPSLREDIATLEAMLPRTLHSEDWMVPDMQNKLEAKLSSFFKDAAARPTYFQTAGRYREVVLAVRNAGVVFAGHVDDASTAHVNAKGINATELWGIGKNGKPVRVPITKGQAKKEEVQDAQKWSPLFLIALDRKAVLTKMQSSDETPEKNPEPPPPAPVPTVSPFLQQP